MVGKSRRARNKSVGLEEPKIQGSKRIFRGNLLLQNRIMVRFIIRMRYKDRLLSYPNQEVHKLMFYSPNNSIRTIVEDPIRPRLPEVGAAWRAKTAEVIETFVPELVKPCNDVAKGMFWKAQV